MARAKNERMKAVLIVAGLALACAGCRSRTPPEYAARIIAQRFAKDAALRAQSEPVPENRKGQLLPLVYYPPDSRYDVLAVLRPSSVTRALPLQMVYSDGVIRDVTRVGTLDFALNGKPLQLAAFVEVAGLDADHMFVPFGDLTNGSETYPGGRILDVERTATGFIDLDFNLAYNPSCYFSPMYSCPVPPKENQLPIAVRAGEKIRVKHME